MKEALTEFFINSQMPYWQAFVWVFIGTLFGFVAGILDDKSAKDARKKVRTREKAKKYEIERLAEGACNEMNDSSKLYSKAFNVLWGTYSNVRVFINAKVKVKKDVAIVHFWLAARNEFIKWAQDNSLDGIHLPLYKECNDKAKQLWNEYVKSPKFKNKDVDDL